MPELPEVQTIVSDLKKVLPGLKIRDVWTDWKKMIKYPKSFPAFKKDLIGKKILKVDRKGKNILIDLSGGKTLLIHQKMTGHLLYGSFKHVAGKWMAGRPGPLRDDPQNKFLHLVFDLSNGKQLALSDLRKFAKVLIWKTDDLDNLDDINRIGIDPLDKSFTLKRFKELLSKKRGRIKEVLMKQELIAGIGNIYASEILWEAGVYPFKETTKLKEKELEKIYKSVKKVLKKSLRLRGDSTVDYRDLFGKKGKYQYAHRAYKMEGKVCLKKDGGIIKRVKKGNRSTFYCPTHQKR
jgi:formamidopyrimidine-DNA glycosylase